MQALCVIAFLVHAIVNSCARRRAAECGRSLTGLLQQTQRWALPQLRRALIACWDSKGEASGPRLQLWLAVEAPGCLHFCNGHCNQRLQRTCRLGQAAQLKLVSTAAEGAAAWDGDGMDLSSDVPDEVLRHILSLLSPLCLARAGASCRKWRQLAAEDELWRPHLARLPRAVCGSAAAAAVAGMPGARQQLSRILTGAIAV